jgi:hypothetical protein
MANLFTKGKRKSISQTLLDCGKILLAALVAADFIKFDLLIKIVIIINMVVLMILGVIMSPDETQGE